MSGIDVILMRQGIATKSAVVYPLWAPTSCACAESASHDHHMPFELAFFTWAQERFKR